MIKLYSIIILLLCSTLSFGQQLEEEIVDNLFKTPNLPNGKELFLSYFSNTDENIVFNAITPELFWILLTNKYVDNPYELIKKKYIYDDDNKLIVIVSLKDDKSTSIKFYIYFQNEKIIYFENSAGFKDKTGDEQNELQSNLQKEITKIVAYPKCNEAYTPDNYPKATATFEKIIDDYKQSKGFGVSDIDNRIKNISKENCFYRIVENYEKTNYDTIKTDIDYFRQIVISKKPKKYSIGYRLFFPDDFFDVSNKKKEFSSSDITKIENNNYIYESIYIKEKENKNDPNLSKKYNKIRDCSFETNMLKRDYLKEQCQFKFYKYEINFNNHNSLTATETDIFEISDIQLVLKKISLMNFNFDITNIEIENGKINSVDILDLNFNIQ